MSGRRRLRNRSNSPPRRKLPQKLNVLPFSANPDQLQMDQSTVDVSPDLQTENGTYKSSTLPAGLNNVSPLRAKTMKEYDQVIGDLKKENFSLKLRIYFLEEKMQQKYGGSDDHLAIYKMNLELKVEVESLKRELKEKIKLLSQASSGFESLERQHKSNVESLQERMIQQKAESEEKIQHLNEALRIKDKIKLDGCDISTMTESSNDYNAIIQELRGKLKAFEDQSILKNKTIQGFVEAVKFKESKIRSLQQELDDKGVNLKIIEDELRAAVKKFNSSAANKVGDESCERTCQTGSKNEPLGKSSIQSLQEEIQKLIYSYSKMCTEKDKLIDQLQKSVCDLESVVQSKINNQKHETKIASLQDKISKLQKEITDKDKLIEENNNNEDHTIIEKLKNRLDHYSRLLSSVGIDLVVRQHNYSNMNRSHQLSDSPPVKLTPSPSSKSDAVGSKIVVITSSADDDHESDNCVIHKKEIDDLRQRLVHSVECFELLECRLEEIADFLERLLCYDGTGNLTPQQVSSLKRYLNESRNLSHSLSATLLGSSYIDYECSSPNLIRLSTNNVLTDIIPEHEPIDRRSLPRMSLSDTGNIGSVSVQRMRRADSCHKQALMDSFNFPKSTSMDQNLLLNYNSRRINHDKSNSEDARDLKNDTVPQVANAKMNEVRPSTTANQPNIGAGSASDSDVWSEPDRNVSLQRIGLDSFVLQPSTRNVWDVAVYDENSSSSTATELPPPNSFSLGNKRGKNDESTVKQLETKLRNVQELNDMLKDELRIHQDMMKEKATDTAQTLSPGFMAKHLAAVRSLHQKLEQTIKTNESLQHTLEEKLVSTEQGDVSKATELKTELTELRSRLKCQEEAYKRVCNVNAEMQEKFIEKCQDNDKEKLASIEANNEINERDRIISNLQTANESFEKHMLKLTSELEHAIASSKTNGRLEEQLEEKQSHLSIVEASLAKKKNKLKEVQDWNLRLQNEISTKENLLQESRSEMEIAKKRNEQIIESTTEERLQFKSSAKWKDVDLDRLRMELNVTTAKVNHLELQKMDLEKRLEMESSKLISQSASNRELLAKMKKDLEEAHCVTVKELEDKLSTVALQNDELTSKNEVLNDRIVEMSSNLFSNDDTNRQNKVQHLDGRVRQFLDECESNSSDNGVDRLSGNGPKIHEANTSSVNQSSNLEDKVDEIDGNGRRSLHYSSPDLGIESDPCNCDGKNVDESVIQRELSSIKRKSNPLANVTTKLNVKGRDNVDGMLHAFTTLYDYELLKKQLCEGLVTLKGLQSRINDQRTIGYDSFSSQELSYCTVKELQLSARNLETCLQQSNRLVHNFSLLDASSWSKSKNQEYDSNLLAKNRLLEKKLSTLTRDQQLHVKERDEAVNNLMAARRRKKDMEKAICKQLQKTNQVLKLAKNSRQKTDN